MKDFKTEIEKRTSEGLLRTLSLDEGQIDFLSNDYLGMACQKMDISGFNGSTGSRLLSGNSAEIEGLETKISTYHNCKSALIFNSGYSANLGVLSCLPSRTDSVIMDELCHASLIDGVVLSKASRYKFNHNDLLDLESKLHKSSGDKFVVIESTYSMDGTESNISAISDLCKRYNAILIIDEAHSIGISGERGSGISAPLLSLPESQIIRVITYGKAFGSHGAAVLTDSNIKKYLINYSRPFIYSTAPSPHQVESIKLAYENIFNADENRKKLEKLIAYWKQSLPLHLNWIESNTQIQSLVISGNTNVIALSDHLQDENFSVLPIRKPTVKAGLERIRFCLHSYNTFEEIDLLFSKLAVWKKEE